jgi:acyl-CoA thioesterase YciA
MGKEPYLALAVLMMPRDANILPPIMLPGEDFLVPHLSIFGGVILSYIDQAGAIGARREVVQAGGRLPILVTVAVNRVEFKQPVLVGDVVRFLTRLIKLGRTSITMHVNVESERDNTVLQVTEAELVYVGVDATGPQRRPVPLVS